MKLMSRVNVRISVPAFVALAIAFLGAMGLARAQSAQDVIPRPPELQTDIDFWIRVYSQITTNDGFLHDERDLSVIYETLRFAPNSQPKQRAEVVDEARKRYQAILERLAAHPAPGSFTGEELRVSKLWGKASTDRLQTAREGIRFQLGQADRFHAGLVRAGSWEVHIAQTLANLGLPPALAKAVTLRPSEATRPPMCSKRWWRTSMRCRSSARR